MQWTTGYDEIIESFANNISTTEGGTHETGFKSALTKGWVGYEEKYELMKQQDDLTGDEV